MIKNNLVDTNGQVYQNNYCSSSTWRIISNLVQIETVLLITLFVHKIRFKLALPSTAEENDFIRDHINGGSWMGITDKSSEKTFRDESGQKIGWTNWKSGQPDNANWLFGLISGGKINQDLI